MESLRFLAEDNIGKIEKKLAGLFLYKNDIFNDLEHFLLKKSKRIRSVVSILYLGLNEADINDDIITLLSAVELIHNASLLHDDVIDGAQIRRGDITVSEKYNSKIAVLSGDYLLSFAINLLNSLNNDYIFMTLSDVTKRMCEAEVKQYLLRNNTETIDEYIDIIYGKTASLFEGVLKCTANLSNIDVEIAGTFGKLFGLLFQINNDLSTLSAENDKINGVKTAIDILGVEKTNNLKDNYKEDLRAILEDFSDNKYKQGLKDLINLL
jgi:geranylgeranyl pyrophosphate synthase